MNQTPQTITIDIRPLLMPIAIVLAAAILGGSLVVSANTLSGSGLRVAGNNTNTGTTTSAANNAGTKEFEFEMAIDDDAILGNKDAKVAIIEYAAYDCPYCDRHYKQVYSELKKQYVDTGKAFIVYRDSPLSGPSQIQANAAECARKQGGDSAYYKFHDYLFDNFYTDNTQSAKTTWTVEKVRNYANSIGLKGDDLAKCVTDVEFEDEIAADQADLQKLATTLGLRGLGVPSFIIGRVENGVIKGKVSVDTAAQSVVSESGNLINGAYPLDAFKKIIDGLQ
jgi:protein-disulfide isomerase